MCRRPVSRTLRLLGVQNCWSDYNGRHGYESTCQGDQRSGWAGRHAVRVDQALEADADVDGAVAELQNLRGDDVIEIAGAAIDEIQFLPALREDTGEDGTARDAGDQIELAEQAAIVETLEAAQAEERGAEATAGEGQT